MDLTRRPVAAAAARAVSRDLSRHSRSRYSLLTYTRPGPVNSNCKTGFIFNRTVRWVRAGSAFDWSDPA